MGLVVIRERESMVDIPIWRTNEWKKRDDREYVLLTGEILPHAGFNNNWYLLMLWLVSRLKIHLPQNDHSLESDSPYVLNIISTLFPVRAIPMK